MKQIVLILGLVWSLSTNAWADICYEVSEKVAQKAVDIIQRQK